MARNSAGSMGWRDGWNCGTIGMSGKRGGLQAEPRGLGPATDGGRKGNLPKAAAKVAMSLPRRFG